MELLHVDKRFIRCADAPQNGHAYLSPLNVHEFLIASGFNFKDMDGIRKYNIHKDKWTEMMKYPKKKNMHIEDVTTDHKEPKSKIYLLESNDDRLMEFDINTKLLSNFKCNYGVGTDSSMVNINGVFHSIGGNDTGGAFNSKHRAINSDNDERAIIHDFKQDGIEYLRNLSTIYVKSKQMILLIGGNDFYNDKMMGIWQFCLNENQWDKLEQLEFDYDTVSCYLTSDQKYIVIGGGCTLRGNYMDKLYVLDIRKDNEYKLIESTIKLSSALQGNYKGNYKIIGSGGIKDEILVIGWIKELFKTSEFKVLSLPPMYIMKWVSLWYNQEMVHFLDLNTCEHNHYCIKLKHILNSLL